MRKINLKTWGWALLFAVLILSAPFGYSVGLPSFEKPPCHTDNRMIDLENPFYQGNFGYRYPIDVPSGINGMEPTLALVYNSELDQEKYIGVGWELIGLNTIRRNDRVSTPWYDQRDAYILTLNGKEYVINQDDTFEEQGSMKCEHNGDDWLIYEGDGTVMIFSPAARSPKGIYSWTLREQKDTNGNTVTYTYDDSLLASDGVSYLSSITYLDSNDEQVTVSLIYEYSNDQDGKELEPAKSYWSGFKTYYRKRLSRINAGDVIYQLDYKNPSNTSGRWLLREIIPSEGDPVNFQYDSDDLDAGERWEYQEKPGLLPGLSNYISKAEHFHYKDFDLLVRDFNNDGLPDCYVQKHQRYFEATSLILELDYLPEIYLNDGNGGWTPAFDFNQDRSQFSTKYKHWDESPFDIPSGVYIRPDITQDLTPRIFDINGDGLLDIVLTAHYHYESLEQQTTTNPYDPSQVEFTNTVLAIRWDETETLVFVNNGQGGFQFSVKFNEYVPSNIFDRDAPIGQPPFNGSVPPIITDVNGDNTPDYFSKGTYYINQGDHTYQPLQSGAELKNYFDRRKVDLNGDGIDETITYDWKTGQVTCSDPRYNLMLSEGDREFNRAFAERLSGYHYDSFIDFNQDGLPDLVTLNGVFINKTKSDRLIGISGDEKLSVAYTRVPADSQYGENMTKKGPKVYRWAVQSISADGSTTTFNYEGGLYDMECREFRGYDKINVLDEDGTTTYAYNPANRALMGKVTSVTSPDGSVAYDYQINGNERSWRLEQLKTVSSSEGITSTSTNDYDEDGNLIQQRRHFTDGRIEDNRTSIYTYSKNGSRHIVNTLEGSVEKNQTGDTIQENRYFYDEQNSGYVQVGNLTQIDSKVWPKETGSEDLTVRIGYDGRGVANAVMDAQGNRTTTELLTMNAQYKKRVTRNALGHESYELIETATGLTVESVDANGAKTTYTYYPDKRLKRVTRPDGGFTEYEYKEDSTGTTTITRTKVETGSNLLQWHEEHSDLKGNLNSTLDKQVRALGADFSAPFETVGRPVLTQKRYNDRGQASAESLTYFEGQQPKFVTYDYETTRKHRLLKVTQPDRSEIKYEYNDANHQVTVIDPKGNRTVSEESYDYATLEGRGTVACRIVAATDALSQVTRAYYDLDGNLLQTVDANGKAKVYWYDSLGRVYKSTDPYKGEVHYIYGANGQLKTRTDAKGQVIAYEYDILNRLTAKVFPGGRRTTWTYDRTTADNAVHTYGIGRLSGYTDTSGTTLLGYDAAGNLVKKSHGSLNLAFSYDLLDRVRSITYPNSYRVDYAYDDLGLSAVSAGSKILASYTERNGFGQAQQVEYANGIRTAFSYNIDNGLLKNIQVGGGYQLNLSYTHDLNGNVASVQDMAPVTAYHPGVNHESYTYDVINRLITSNGPYGTLSYSYDAVGNITAKEGVTFTYGDPDHPYAVTEGSNGYRATYDKNGNMITRTDSYGNTYSLIYDEENQLTRVIKNENYTEDYTYDATGYRVVRSVGLIRTDYTYWGNTLLYEATGSKTIDYVWAEGKLIAKVEQAGTTYFTHDHLGSSKLQTDDNGNVISTDVSRPFGPRVCDESLKETFADSSRINLTASRINYDATNGSVLAPATGRAQSNMLALNHSVSVIGLDYSMVKMVEFRLTDLDKARKVNVRFNAIGKSRVRVIGEDGSTYLTKEYSTRTDASYLAQADLSLAPSQTYTVYLDLAGVSTTSMMASNSLFEVTWGNLGARLGELVTLPYDLQEEVRSVRLSWVGTGVAFMISTDNKTWENVTNGEAVTLKNPGKRIWLKGLLTVDANTVLDVYQLEVNPTKYSLFTGKTLEESTGLVYFGGRWYDPEIGRFITVDPAEQGDGWYSYCSNNPINAVDPDGLWSGTIHRRITYEALQRAKLKYKGKLITEKDYDTVIYANLGVDNNKRTSALNSVGRHQNVFDNSTAFGAWWRRNIWIGLLGVENRDRIWLSENRKLYLEKLQQGTLEDEITREESTVSINAYTPEYIRMAISFCKKQDRKQYTDSRLGYANRALLTAVLLNGKGEKNLSLKSLGQGLHILQDMIGHGAYFGASILHDPNRSDEIHGIYSDSRYVMSVQLSVEYIKEYSQCTN